MKSAGIWSIFAADLCPQLVRKSSAGFPPMRYWLNPGTFQRRSSPMGEHAARLFKERSQMLQKTLRITAAATLLLGASTAAYAAGPSDPQIAHIAYTAGNIDIAAAKQALARSHNK